MRSSAACVAIFTLMIGLPACGKYGPPVRSVPQPPPSPPEATEAEPQVLEEAIPEPADFDEAQADQENAR